MEAATDEDYAALRALHAQEEGDEKARFLRLLGALEGRLHVYYQGTMGKMSRAHFQSKARSVTAGWAFRDAYGEGVFTAAVDEVFDTEIPHFDKPDTDRPPRKRPLPDPPADDPERATKRGRTDPATISDRELAREHLRCGVCRVTLTSRDSCYTRSWSLLHDDDTVCLSCWREDYTKTHCDLCDGTQEIWRVGYDGVFFYRCKACKQRFDPPTVVRLQRTENGVIVRGCDVYIGRRCTLGGWNLEESVWANPFRLPKGKCTPEQRQEVLARYEAHVRSKPKLMARIPELAAKTLGCFCKPQPCHGDVLVRLFEEWATEHTQI